MVCSIAPLVRLATLKFHGLLRLYGLLRWSSNVCSVGKPFSIDVPLFAPFIRFAPLETQCRLPYLVCSVGVLLSAPLVSFAPFKFHC